MRTGICCGLAAAALVPTPIGRGPLYHPPAGPVRVACTDAPLRSGLRVHLELFANKRVVIVPAGIGVRDPVLSRGNVTGARCRARIWTVDPTGVVWLDRSGETLGSVFAVWGEPLGPATARRIPRRRVRVRERREAERRPASARAPRP